jgi:hypothetical protein
MWSKHPAPDEHDGSYLRLNFPINFGGQAEKLFAAH